MGRIIYKRSLFTLPYGPVAQLGYLTDALSVEGTKERVCLLA